MLDRADLWGNVMVQSEATPAPARRVAVLAEMRSVRSVVTIGALALAIASAGVITVRSAGDDGVAAEPRAVLGNAVPAEPRAALGASQLDQAAFGAVSIQVEGRFSRTAVFQTDGTSVLLDVAGAATCDSAAEPGFVGLIGYTVVLDGANIGTTTGPVSCRGTRSTALTPFLSGAITVEPGEHIVQLRPLKYTSITGFPLTVRVVCAGTCEALTPPAEPDEFFEQQRREFCIFQGRDPDDC